MTLRTKTPPVRSQELPPPKQQEPQQAHWLPQWQELPQHLPIQPIRSRQVSSSHIRRHTNRPPSAQTPAPRAHASTPLRNAGRW